MGLVLFVAFAGLLLFIVRRMVDAETAKNVKFLGKLVLAICGIMLLVGLLLIMKR